jgi:hypothetical protein
MAAAADHKFGISTHQGLKRASEVLGSDFSLPYWGMNDSTEAPPQWVKFSGKQKEGRSGFSVFLRHDDGEDRYHRDVLVHSCAKAEGPLSKDDAIAARNALAILWGSAKRGNAAERARRFGSTATSTRTIVRYVNFDDKRFVAYLLFASMKNTALVVADSFEVLKGFLDAFVGHDVRLSITSLLDEDEAMLAATKSYPSEELPTDYRAVKAERDATHDHSTGMQQGRPKARAAGGAGVSSDDREGHAFASASASARPVAALTQGTRALGERSTLEASFRGSRDTGESPSTRRTSDDLGGAVGHEAVMWCAKPTMDAAAAVDPSLLLDVTKALVQAMFREAVQDMFLEELCAVGAVRFLERVQDPCAFAAYTKADFEAAMREEVFEDLARAAEAHGMATVLSRPFRRLHALAHGRPVLEHESPHKRGDVIVLTEERWSEVYRGLRARASASASASASSGAGDRPADPATLKHSLVAACHEKRLLFHGTTEFSAVLLANGHKFMPSRDMGLDFGIGFYLTPSFEVAKTYSGGDVSLTWLTPVEAHLSTKKRKKLIQRGARPVVLVYTFSTDRDGDHVWDVPSDVWADLVASCRRETSPKLEATQPLREWPHVLRGPISENGGFIDKGGAPKPSSDQQWVVKSTGTAAWSSLKLVGIVWVDAV